jgi:hypothetical protein
LFTAIVAFFSQMSARKQPSRYLGSLEPEDRQKYLDKLAEFGVQTDLFSITSGDVEMHGVTLQAFNVLFLVYMKYFRPWSCLFCINAYMFCFKLNMVKFKLCHLIPIIKND